MIARVRLAYAYLRLLGEGLGFDAARAAEAGVDYIARIRESAAHITPFRARYQRRQRLRHQQFPATLHGLYEYHQKDLIFSDTA